MSTRAVERSENDLQTYCLMDGAMAYGVVTASKVLSNPQTSWVVPLLLNDDLRLAGPLLIDITGVSKSSERGQEIFRAWQAYPRQLHVSLITSKLSIQELAEHLRCFIHFRDSAGDTYGLRLGDCRVLDYLHTVLSPQQWLALTAPMTHWKISSRDGGDRLPMPLDGERLRRSSPPEPLHLGDEQIAKLIDCNEPDALLAQIGLSPGFDNEEQTQGNHQTALACVQAWKSEGITSRSALRRIAEQVFQHSEADRNNQAWVFKKAQELIQTQ